MPLRILPVGKTTVLTILLLSVTLCFTNCRKNFNNTIEPIPNAGSNKAMRLYDSLSLPDSRPNIIIFIATDVGYEVPAFTGGHSYQTPALDMMAANGLFFMHSYRHPDGSPSRLAFYTGKYNFRNYISWAHYPYSEKTFANMLSDTGYKTCFVGKWQQSDGDYGITQRGWQKYLVFLPFQGNESQRVNRYKNPKLYQDGAYLPGSETNGKYSEDMFSDYVCSFIDSNTVQDNPIDTTVSDTTMSDSTVAGDAKRSPFLAVYSFNLAGKPYVPTPDDPEFTNWDPALDNENSDTKYYSSMVQYMDKTISKILNKLQQDGIADNTYIFYLSATAVFRDVSSVWGPDFKNLKGGKMHSNLWGTLNPLLVYCPGKITPRTDRSTLIDYTDFLPTLADLTNTPRPIDYGTLDGISFADNIWGVPGEDRSWVFCHWDNDATKNPPVQRWVNDTMYKLYDTLGYTKFYNTVKDTMEKKPIPDNKLTLFEQIIKQNFINILQQEHN